MNLVTEYGRYDRAAIVARARELLGVMEWGAAMSTAYREASDELRRRFNRHSTVPSVAIRKSEAA